MIERGGGPSFAAKTLQRLRIAGDVIGKELEGDESAQAGVFGLVHDSHSATAQLLYDAVVRDSRIDHVPAESWKPMLIVRLIATARQFISCLLSAKSWIVGQPEVGRKNGFVEIGAHGAARNTTCPPRRRIIKGRPFEVGFECDAKLYRKEHPYGH